MVADGSIVYEKIKWNNIKVSIHKGLVGKSQ